MTPEKIKRDGSLPKTASESMPQLPSLFRAQSTHINAAGFAKQNDDKI